MRDWQTTSCAKCLPERPRIGLNSFRQAFRQTKIIRSGDESGLVSRAFVRSGTYLVRKRDDHSAALTRLDGVLAITCWPLNELHLECVLDKGAAVEGALL